MAIFAVRHRFNYNLVQIELDGACTGKSLTGNKLPVLQRNGESKFFQFSGSLDINQRFGHQLAKVINIAAYSIEPADVLHRQWIEVPAGHYCAAALINESLQFITDNKRLVTRPLPARPSPPENNVVQLFPKSTK